ncbi:MAG: HAD-IIIC family phosphatase [Nitrosopumilaceae archaeon]
MLDSKLHEKKIRIAFLSSFTINGLEETVRVKCHEIDVGCQTYVAGYNQYNQEILNENSGLYSFKPEITFLMLDSREILSDLFYFPYSISTLERQEFIKKKLSDLSELIVTFNKNAKSKLILTNFVIPTYSPYGIYENKIEYGLKEMIKDLNSKLEMLTQNFESIYCFDMNGFVTRFGEHHVFNFREFFFGDVKVSIAYIPYLAYDFMGYVKPMIGLTKKCIVLDLDNTLWGGIVGEDEFEGIKIGQNAAGKPYTEFQQLLLSLNQRGVILAINSSNNFDDAMKVINEHPNMILKEENFACLKINWNNKVTNMEEIAAELNIGLDSMVFIDDDPVNREMVSKNLPGVLVIDLPKDPSKYTAALMALNDFNLLKITQDDINRGKMYLQERKRKDFQSSTTNLEEFLKQLNIKIKIKNANTFTIPRISQLTLKTNQFNLTTKRYQEEEIKQIAEDNNWFVGCAQVEDKFGDNGITGVFIVKKENKNWFLDTLLLSCRVMGRGIEEGILSYILQKAKEEDASTLKGKFIPTKKNKPSENFLKNYGFKKEGDYWIFSLTNPIRIPSHLTIRTE